MKIIINSIEMEIPELSKLNQLQIQERNIKRYYPEFYNYINIKYSNINKWTEKLYLYYNNLEEPPKCANPNCNKPAKFISLYKGYQLYCCIKCSDSDPLTHEKRKQTNLERYGVENPMQSKDIQDKAKQTNLERYGVENAFASKVIQEKIKQTNLERYGVENPSQSEEIKKKKIQTNLERYDCEWPLQNKNILEKVKQTNIERYGNECSLRNETVQNKVKQTNLERYGAEYSIQADIVQNKVKQTNLERYGVENAAQSQEVQEKMKSTNLERYNVDNIFKIPNFYEKYCIAIQPTSKIECELQDYIKSLGHNIIKNDRKAVKYNELDIYIPDLNIAIEYNGSYWHSLLQKDSKYHLNKWKACYNAGIELISIWESWLLDDIRDFIKLKLDNQDISIYKQKWFPDLNNNEWPLDLGYLKNYKIDINNIKEHFCIHNKYECCDSGILMLLKINLLK